MTKEENKRILDKCSFEEKARNIKRQMKQKLQKKMVAIKIRKKFNEFSNEGN